MRTLALLAVAAAADGGDYTLYPGGSWAGVKCDNVSCNHSGTSCKTVSQGCSANKDMTVIFVDSQSRSSKSKDAFAVEGNVDTAKWATNEHSYASWCNINKYDSEHLKLKGMCEGRTHLAEKDAHCRAECADGSDEVVTLAKYVVQDRFTKRAIVDCDGDKKNLLDALRDDVAVERFLDNSKNDASTASPAVDSQVDLADPTDESGQTWSDDNIPKNGRVDGHVPRLEQEDQADGAAGSEKAASVTIAQHLTTRHLWQVRLATGGALDQLPGGGRDIAARAIAECNLQNGLMWDTCVQRVVAEAVAQQKKIEADNIPKNGRVNAKRTLTQHMTMRFLWGKVMTTTGGVLNQLHDGGRAIAAQAIAVCNLQKGLMWDTCVQRVVAEALAQGEMSLGAAA